MKYLPKYSGAVVLLAGLLMGCQNPEPATCPGPGPCGAEAPTRLAELPPFPEEQVPAAEPQPAAEVFGPAETVERPVDTTALVDKEAPAVSAWPSPKESYAPPVVTAPRTYVVRRGDTLQRISKRFYGTTRRWRRVYNANRGELGDPDKIQIGMRLVIPQ